MMQIEVTDANLKLHNNHVNNLYCVRSVHLFYKYAGMHQFYITFIHQFSFCNKHISKHELHNCHLSLSDT